MADDRGKDEMAPSDKNIQLVLENTTDDEWACRVQPNAIVQGTTKESQLELAGLLRVLGESREVAYGRFRLGSNKVTGLLLVSYKQTLSRRRGQMECHIAQRMQDICDCPLEPLRLAVDDKSRVNVTPLLSGSIIFKNNNNKKNKGALANNLPSTMISGQQFPLATGTWTKPRALSSLSAGNQGPGRSSLQVALSNLSMGTSSDDDHNSNNNTPRAVSKTNKHSGMSPLKSSSLRAALIESKSQPANTAARTEVSRFRPVQVPGALVDKTRKWTMNPNPSPTTVVDDLRLPTKSENLNQSGIQGDMFEKFRRALDHALVEAFALVDGDENEPPESLEAWDVRNDRICTDFKSLSMEEQQLFVDSVVLTVDVFNSLFSMALVVRPGCLSMKKLTTTTIFLSRQVEGQHCKRKEKSKVCTHWLKNACKKGGSCTFLHDHVNFGASLASKNSPLAREHDHHYQDPGPKKNKVCSHWLKNACRNGDTCQFAHSLVKSVCQANQFQNYGQRKICYYWLHQGDCWKGDTGPFVHSGCNETAMLDSSKAEPRKICHYWLEGDCWHGDECRNVHSM